MRINATILLVSIASGCATAPMPEPPPPVTASVDRTPVLRLMDITPVDGSRVDSSTVIVATVAYHIPNFDPSANYEISAVFAGADGAMFNRGGDRAEVRRPAGIVTVQQSLERLWTAGPIQPVTPVTPVTPLTGTFFLVEQNRPPSVGAPPEVEEGIQIRSVVTRSPVLARTRTFYFNGSGPARTLAVGLLNVVEEYWTFQRHKALALAYDAPDRWTHGYAYGYRTIDEAKERALEECRAAAQRREIGTPCQIIATNEEAGDP